MPLFEYSALDAGGRKRTGFVDSMTTQSAKDRLREDGLYVVSISSASAVTSTASRREFSLFSRVTRADLAAMTNQLATLLKAGLPIVSALEVLMEQMEKPAVRKVLSGVRNQVAEGASFHEALAHYPSAFPPMYVQMCRAGETGGFLDKIMLRLAESLEKDARLKGQVLGALIYPVVMTIFGFVFLMFLFAYVIPQVVGIFSDFGNVLPLPTRVLLIISDLFSGYWFFVLFLAGIILAAYNFMSRSERFGLTIDSAKLKLPLFGKLAMKMAVARLSHVLGTLLSSGVPMMRALEVTGEVLGNRVLAAALKESAIAVSRGGSLADSLRGARIFPPMLPRVVAVGERSGELAPMLLDIAGSYEEEVNRASSALTALLGPILILAMASVVLFVVLAVLLPIFELNQLVKPG